ncbi:CDGSH iron-sulfur domain-containing protein [Saccharicrinis sp. FJH54]|uniref:CDGSH iron-sulfur domain-containing protein n=1 Tax=Saccharicrinis sp. FJH54 TaxID=3344665 RepID=UPI0035D41B0E
MKKGQIAGRAPRITEIEKDKTYAWCRCGRSGNQPFCDGSHKVTEFTPVVFKAEETKKVAFCMCKQTSTPPFCDGTHNTLK